MLRRHPGSYPEEALGTVHVFHPSKVSTLVHVSFALELQSLCFSLVAGTKDSSVQTGESVEQPGEELGLLCTASMCNCIIILLCCECISTTELLFVGDVKSICYLRSSGEC